MAGFHADIIFPVILLMAADAPAHGKGLDPSIDRHVRDIAVAIAADFPDGSVLPEIETLDMTLMVEADIVRKIVDFLPRNGLLVIPVPEKLLDPWLVPDRLDALVTPYALVDPGDHRYVTPPCPGMTVHAVDPHIPRMPVMGKLDGLLDDRPKGVVTVRRLRTDRPAPLEWLGICHSRESEDEKHCCQQSMDHVPCSRLENAYHKIYPIKLTTRHSPPSRPKPVLLMERIMIMILITIWLAGAAVPGPRLPAQPVLSKIDERQDEKRAGPLMKGPLLSMAIRVPRLILAFMNPPRSICFVLFAALALCRPAFIFRQYNYAALRRSSLDSLNFIDFIDRF